MIKNLVLRQRIDAIKKEKAKLSAEKMDITASLKELNITKQAAWEYGTDKVKTSCTIKQDTIDLRNVYTKRIIQIEIEFQRINEELRELHKEDDSEINQVLVKIFKEVFTTDQMAEMNREARRRVSGEPPLKLSFSIKDAVEVSKERNEYRNIASEQVNKMIEFRITLTRLIEEGCKQFGDGEFLKFISPLNRLVIPIKELELIKRKHFL